MRKILAGMLAGAMILGTLTGCSGGQETTGAAAEQNSKRRDSGKEESASGDVKTLDVVWFSDGKEGESFMRLARGITELHPDIKIELIEVRMQT